MNDVQEDEEREREREQKFGNIGKKEKEREK